MYSFKLQESHPFILWVSFVVFYCLTLKLIQCVGNDLARIWLEGCVGWPPGRPLPCWRPRQLARWCSGSRLWPSTCTERSPCNEAVTQRPRWLDLEINATNTRQNVCQTFRLVFLLRANSRLKKRINFLFSLLWKGMSTQDISTHKRQVSIQGISPLI